MNFFRQKGKKRATQEFPILCKRWKVTQWERLRENGERYGLYLPHVKAPETSYDAHK